jgi:hypothetical protein
MKEMSSNAHDERLAANVASRDSTECKNAIRFLHHPDKVDFREGGRGKCIVAFNIQAAVGSIMMAVPHHEPTVALQERTPF